MRPSAGNGSVSVQSGETGRAGAIGGARVGSPSDFKIAWVVVVAEGYGTVVVPVRHDSMPTEKLREKKELFVPIGLVPTE